MRTRTWIRALVAAVAFLACSAVPGQAWAKGAAGPGASTQPAASQPAGTQPDQEAKLVAFLEISGQLTEGGQRFAWMGDQDQGMSLHRAVKLISGVADDATLSGLVISLDGTDLRLSQVDALSTAIRRVRAKGKTVMVFAEAYDLPMYALACEADKILLQHKGQLELPGLSMEEMYYADLLKKVGAKADYLQVGDYKGADEAMTRTGPSAAWNKNIDGLLDDLYNQVVERIGRRRHLTREQVEKLFSDCWVMDDKDCLAAGAVDVLTGADLAEATGPAWGDSFNWKDLTAAGENAGATPDNPLAMLSMLFQDKTRRATRASIAVINAVGEIDSGQSNTASPRLGLLNNEPSIGSKTMQDMLTECRNNDLIHGVVIRIDSPGGSALASEIIWQAIREVGMDKDNPKPVYVSVGSMAASGGYYMSSASKVIYVQPSSIVGSIGVVGGKFVMGPLYDKLGVAVVRRHRGPGDDMFNSVVPFTDDQRAALTKAFEKTYAQFIDRVTTGREKKIADITAVAQGRLFTGRQAVANGMADKIGGEDDAVTDMAAELGLKPGSYDVIQMPGPMSLAEFLQRTFQQLDAPNLTSIEAGAPLLSTLRSLAGPKLWSQAGPAVRGLLLLQHEPVLTLMPEAIIIK